MTALVAGQMASEAKGGDHRRGWEHVAMGRERFFGGGFGRRAPTRSMAALICIAALSAVALVLPVLDVELALAAETGGPIAGQARVRSQASKWIVRAAGASPISRCLATWDRTSGMSKKQWKSTCKRVVKENPGLYSKPF
jgi:hypothetical protein